MERMDKKQLSPSEDSPAMNNHEMNQTCEGSKVKSSLQIENPADSRTLNVCQISGDLDELEDGRVRIDGDCSTNASSCPRKDQDVQLPDCGTNCSLFVVVFCVYFCLTHVSFSRDNFLFGFKFKFSLCSAHCNLHGFVSY